MKKLNKKSGLPLYLQLEERIISDIRAGKYPSGSLLPSISELERSNDVGRVTIVATMKRLVADGFACARQGKGYYVAHPVEKGLVGVIVPLQSTVYMDIYVNLFAGIRGSILEPEYKMLFQTSEENPNQFAYALDELVRKKGVRWLVAVPPMDEYEKVYPQCLDRLLRLKNEFSDLKIVIVDRKVESEEFLVITQNRKAGVELIISEAAKISAKKVLFLENTAGGGESFERHAAECESMIPKEMEFKLKRWSDPENDLDIIINGKYDTVFCASDYYARRIFNTANQKISFRLAGYNGTAMAQSCRPTIATVNPNLAEAGEIAVEYLSGRMEFENNKIDVKPFFMPGETFPPQGKSND